MHAPRSLPARIALLFCGALSCAGRPQVAPAPRAAAAAASPEITSDLLENLYILATGTEPTPHDTAQMAAQIHRGERTLAQYVDGLLTERRFGEEVAPRIILGYFGGLTPFPDFPLWKTEGTAGAPPIYFRWAPCDRRSAVTVHPWWDMDHEVLVCPDSYQPTHTLDKEHDWFCSGRNQARTGSHFCGCGQNLINCVTDAQRDAIFKAIKEERDQTIAYVVNRDLPIDRLFTMNETVRNPYAEFEYQRWRVETGEIPAVPKLDFQQPAKLAPRTESTPGQHAGLLTTLMVFSADSPRARMRDFFSTLWCTPTDSVNVSTEQILDLGTTNLRDGEGWRKLAAMPVCTNCHARLDYGMQFFLGYSNTYRGYEYLASEHQQGLGALYGRDIQDRRGEAPLSPHGFGELIAKQPEFDACMIQHVTDHVFSGQVSPSEKSKLRDAFQAQHSLRTVVRTALLLYADQYLKGDTSPVLASSSSAAPAPRGPIALPGALRAALEKHCGDCHDEGPRGFLKEATFSRAHVAAMLGQVASAKMPKGFLGLSASERRQLVVDFVAVLFPPEERDEAVRFFSAGMVPLPNRHLVETLQIVRQRAGAPLDAPPPVQLFGYEYSHAFAAMTARVAMQACIAAKVSGAALTECVDRALRPEGLLGGGAARLPAH